MLPISTPSSVFSPYTELSCVSRHNLMFTKRRPLRRSGGVMSSCFRHLLRVALFSSVVSTACLAQSSIQDVPLPGHPNGLALNPFTNLIYAAVTDIGPNVDGVAVIDGKSNTLVTTVTVKRGADLVTVDELRNRVYVAGCDYAYAPPQCELATIDAGTNQVIAVLPIDKPEGSFFT